MKLADCEVFVVGNPPPRKGGRYFIFVKLTTDDGITGIGEVYAATFGPHVVADMVRDVFARIDLTGFDKKQVLRDLGVLGIRRTAIYPDIDNLVLQIQEFYKW